MDTPAEVDAEIGGQKFKYTGPLNTLASVVAAGAAAFACYIGLSHAQVTHEDQGLLVLALKEQTAALRENSCVQTYRGPEDQRATFCAKVTK